VPVIIPTQLALGLAELKLVLAGETGQQFIPPIDHDQELRIKEMLVPRLFTRIENEMNRVKDLTNIPSPFDLNPPSTTPVQDYLNNLTLFRDSTTVPVCIYFAIILDAWLENNRKYNDEKEIYGEGGFSILDEDRRYHLTQANCHMIILISFLLAENFHNDSYSGVKDIAQAGDVVDDKGSYVVLKEMRDLFLVSAHGDVLPDQYERYHNALLPEYNLDLTPRQNPVLPEEKIHVSTPTPSQRIG
jgi:hypothetical protein